MPESAFFLKGTIDEVLKAAGGDAGKDDAQGGDAGKDEADDDGADE